ncbi:MAG TPA: hypothetical protein VHB98_07135 [Chloroflexota bacterium]|nr:hypothetical protein [Chloroflexota bacterium]
MTADTANFLVHLLGFAGFLWIGLYVLARGDAGRVASLTGLTALLTACFFFFNGLLSLVHGQAAVGLNRASWWASVLPVTLWLHLSLYFNPRAAQAPWRIPLLRLNYAVGAALAVLGMATTWFRDYHHPVGDRPVTAGPLFPLYILYLLLSAGFAAYNLSRMGVATGNTVAPAAQDGDVRAQAAAPAGEVRLLVVGAVCFLIGAGYLALNELPGIHWYTLPGPLLLLVGLGAVGATVALRSAVLLGKDLRRDFLYSFTNLLLLLLPSIVVFGTLVGFRDAQRGLAALLLIAIVTTGYTLYDSVREWLDRAFFPPVVREERAAARAYEEALATQPAGPNPELATRKAFDDAVRRALTHLSDPTKLATSPLLNLQTVAHGVADQRLPDDRLNRAAVLKEILLELLDGLRPADRAGGVAGDAYRFYNCLYYPYVQGITRRRGPTVQRQLQERRRRDGSARTDLERVVDWLLQVDEDTFYKWQRRGSDTIAAALREREAAAGGVVPAASSIPTASESRAAVSAAEAEVVAGDAVLGRTGP